MLLQPVILGSQHATSAVNGATTEPRIRINRPDDENARCKVSRVRVQPKDFSQPTQPLTTLSTSNAISPQQERTEPSGPRRCRRGAKSSLRREPNMPADLLRALFGNVTVPSGAMLGRKRIRSSGRRGVPATDDDLGCRPDRVTGFYCDHRHSALDLRQPDFALFSATTHSAGCTVFPVGKLISERPPDRSERGGISKTSL